MLKSSRLARPVLLYFYQGEFTQTDVDAVLEAFKDKDVQFRKVHDINDTRDIVERCTYVSGTVPLIYAVRKAEGVATGGVLADPLNRVNAAKASTKKKSSDDEDTTKAAAVLSTGHLQPTDANIAANLLKEEVEQITAKTEEPSIKADDVKVDENATTAASSVTGQIPADTAKKVANATPVTAPVAAPKAPTK